MEQHEAGGKNMELYSPQVIKMPFLSGQEFYQADALSSFDGSACLGSWVLQGR